MKNKTIIKLIVTGKIVFLTTLILGIILLITSIFTDLSFYFSIISLITAIILSVIWLILKSAVNTKRWIYKKL